MGIALPKKEQSSALLQIITSYLEEIEVSLTAGSPALYLCSVGGVSHIVFTQR